MISTTRLVSRHRRHPGGFTLLEILLAMGLAVILLAIIGQALYMYGRYSTIGRSQVTRSQLARAILKRMETDIRSVVYQPPEDENETADGQAADEGVGEEEIEIEVQDPADAYSSGSIGVVGSADQLVLHISAPSRDLNYSSVLDGESLNARTSDLQSVSWFLAISGADGLPGAAADLSSDLPSYAVTNGTSQGLSRLAGDRMTMNFADAESDVDTLVQSTKLLAPEVTYLQFRYFDGVEWLEEWDSEAMGALPKAIEIIIGFEPLDEGTTTNRKASSSFVDRTANKAETYRLVVALPLAQPYIDESEF